MTFSFKRGRRHAIAVTMAIMAGVGATQLAHAADNWPTKPIRVVVPFPPGGPTDTATRIVGQELSQRLGQPVVIENRAGASGAIAAAAVSKMPADGYTFMMLATPTLLAPHLYPSAKYDVAEDFDPVATVYALPILAVVNPKVYDVNTIQEMIAKAKEEDGRGNYTSAGVGSFGHLTMERLKQLGDFDMMHVPYGGSTPAVTDLLGGQVPMMYADLVAALPHVQAGTLRAIAVSSPERLPMLPDVPTIAEQGFDNFSAVSWGAMVAPKGTPQDIIDRVAKEIDEILQVPAVRDRMIGAGALPEFEGPQGLAERIKSDNEIWGKVIRDNNITAG